MRDRSGLPLDEAVELLEMRVSRLERLCAAQINGSAPSSALQGSVVYGMGDPRLLLVGAYSAEKANDGTIARWFGKTGLVQMIFPHGRGCKQNAELLVRPYKGIDLLGIRFIIDEMQVIPKVTILPKGFAIFEFEISAAFTTQTEIQIHNLPVRSPKDDGYEKDQRLLSFRLFKATFSAVSTEESPLDV